MALKITRSNSIFEVEGPLNSATASFFKTHFIITLNSSNGLSIDINRVTEIDESGMKALKTLHEEASSWNKRLDLIGYRSREINLRLGQGALA